jgi:hypothetical protein
MDMVSLPSEPSDSPALYTKSRQGNNQMSKKLKNVSFPFKAAMSCRGGFMADASAPLQETDVKM